MPKLSHWIAQLLIVLSLIFALLLAVDTLGAEALERAWPGALLWSAISSALFIGSRWRVIRRRAPRAARDKLDRF